MAVLCGGGGVGGEKMGYMSRVEHNQAFIYNV